MQACPCLIKSHPRTQAPPFSRQECRRQLRYCNGQGGQASTTSSSGSSALFFSFSRNTTGWNTTGFFVGNFAVIELVCLQSSSPKTFFLYRDFSSFFFVLKTYNKRMARPPNINDLLFVPWFLLDGQRELPTLHPGHARHLRVSCPSSHTSRMLFTSHVHACGCSRLFHTSSNACLFRMQAAF